MKYRLTLTEKQYHHIAQCVETCHRIACGDIDELRTILPENPDRSLFMQIKHEAFPELGIGETYGWNGGYRGHTRNEKFQKAFDEFQAQGYQIYREMVHVDTITRGIGNVYTSPTLTTNKAEKPIIEVIDE